MKKSLFYLAATLLIATTSCSEDNNDDDPKGQESNITLYAPDDLEEFDLLYENGKAIKKGLHTLLYSASMKR